MGEASVVRLHTTLDPTAQEFRPANCTNPTQVPTAIFAPPLHHVYYYSASPYPPPVNELQVEPFGNAALPYPQFPVNPAYVNPLEEIALPQVQPLSSCPTRSLLLSTVPMDVSESVVRRDLEAFGDVRGVQMERIRDAIVTVHFYDLRHAENAFREMRNQHSLRQRQLRSHFKTLSTQHSWFPRNNFDIPPRMARGLIGGCAVWAEFVMPASKAVPDGNNQGTVIAFNLELDVTASTLKEIFQRFGPVKELRETPLKKHQRFIEFYDVRDAAKAVKEMNGKEIHGKPVVVEFSRPGGHGRKFFNSMFATGTLRSNISPRHQQPPPARPPKLSSNLTSNVPHRPLYSQYQFSPKKLHYTSGRSLNCADKLVDELQSSKCLGRAGNGIERRDSVGTSRRTSPKKVINRQSPPTLKQESPQPRIGIRLRKNNFLKKCDPRFLISENTMEEESDCRDSRTTVMIKNIPNKYSLKLLLKMLDKHCMEWNEEIANDGKDLPLSSYDFVYLPIDFNNKCNVGYGFVNMTSPQGAWRLYKAFHLQPWQVFNSRKICQVSYARLQGLEALKEHFRNSKFPRDMEQYELPVVFLPPRDGIQLTEPLVVAGDMHDLSPLNTSPVEDSGDGGGHPSDAVITADQSEHLMGDDGEYDNGEDS